LEENNAVLQIAGGAAVAGSIWAAGGLIALCTGPFCLAIFVPFFMLAVRPSIMVLYSG